VVHRWKHRSGVHPPHTVVRWAQCNRDVLGGECMVCVCMPVYTVGRNEFWCNISEHGIWDLPF